MSEDEPIFVVEMCCNDGEWRPVVAQLSHGMAEYERSACINRLGVDLRNFRTVRYFRDRSHE